MLIVKKVMTFVRLHNRTVPDFTLWLR